MTMPELTKGERITRKEIKLPGPAHPISIEAAGAEIRVMVAGRVVAQSARALRLEEKGYPPVFYIPRADVDMSLLARTTHYTYCPYKGDCTYYSIPMGGERSEFAVWTYEEPYPAVASIRDHLAFYPTRVDSIEVLPLAIHERPTAMSAGGVLRSCLLSLAVVLSGLFPAAAQQGPSLTVTIHAEDARATLLALQNPALSREEATKVASMYGNQATLRKLHEFNIASTTEDFAEALYLSAHGQLVTARTQTALPFYIVQPKTKQLL
jgi:uncharacterized protein (DUF427 family)